MYVGASPSMFSTVKDTKTQNKADPLLLCKIIHVKRGCNMNG